MIRLVALFMLLGSPAAAHTGHLADVAGHDHWVAGVAIGLAILTGIYGALKGNEPAEDDDGPDAADENDEVPA
ncbi:MAG: DUF6732 family protein [Pseudomonadota bacterium]